MKKKGIRNEKHYKDYKSEQRREKNKLKRILRSNGRKAAEAYALRYLLLGYLKQRMKADD